MIQSTKQRYRQDDMNKNIIYCQYVVQLNKMVGLWCLTPLSRIFQLFRDGHAVLLVEETGVPGESHRHVESR